MLDGECLRLALRAALLLGCAVRPAFTFDRKHYLYADLPHGYQVTQFREPFAGGGAVGGVPIDKIQLEMDTARSGGGPPDARRAGIALLEIVTPPVLASAAACVAFARQTHALLRHAGVCDGCLEAGQFRMDVNVSVTGPAAPADAGPLGTRVEIKNLNSFHALGLAVDAEARRQTALLATGARVAAETRAFHAARRATFALRAKEGRAAYRFLRDHDLPSVPITAAMLAQARADLPPTAEQAVDALQRAHGLQPAQAAALVDDASLLGLFRACTAAVPHADAGLVFHWLTIDLAGLLRSTRASPGAVEPARLCALLALLVDGRVTRSAARTLLRALLEGGGGSDPAQLAADMDLLAVEAGAPELARACAAALHAQPAQAREVAAGTRSLDYFMGPLVRRFRERVQPKQVRDALLQSLAHQSPAHKDD